MGSEANTEAGYMKVARQLSGQSQRSWIEKTFQKRECSKFIRRGRDAGKCCCGRPETWQGHVPQSLNVLSEERWHPYRHTEAKPTDAYGCIEFQGAPHPSKAQYVRLSSYDTKADQVLQLLQNHWGLDLPKLLITVHGGILNFDLQPKLKRVFRKGLLKAAKTTGAWIITGGTNTGVTRHVGDAISDRTLKAKNKIVAIGIAPWGIVENKDDLIGKDVIVPYHCVSSPKTNYSVLNSNHSYFLLVDNGTVGKYGGEIIFRKRLEKYIAHQKICITSGVKGRGVPVICVVLEGGANTIRSVLEYVTDTPPVPVVVCDGSGRAADLLAFSHKYCLDDGTMPEQLRDQLILTIERTFQYSQEQAEKLFMELMLCVKKKELITVFRMGEGAQAQDIDLAVLTALLKGTNASAPDQLSLALTWDRVDIARSHIFVYGQDWPEGSLEQAMMDALINDRVDFVKLLLENGVHMQSFLTIHRLEELYNTRQGPSNTLRYLVRDVRKHFPHGYRYTLPDIGLVLQHLMGGAFRATYCRKRFRQKYNALKRINTAGNSIGNIGQIVTTLPNLVSTKPAEELFPYPFHDLMIWAVLMKRQRMALFMWQHGEEAMAKALMACKLFKAMAQEADQDDLEIEIPDEIRKYAEEFQTLALELLEHCYKIDDDYTQQLLTYELKNFSDQTCLSLSVAANHRKFIAHTCCQMLLNDMWMGGLRMRKSTSLKVLIGILLPPYILALEFKSKEELQLMPQTMEEHLDELEDDASEENVSVSSFEDDQNDYGDELESSFTSAAQINIKENGNLPGDNSMYSNHVYKKKKSPLRLGKKIYEFYNAPITKFWAHTVSYFIFLIIYTYMILPKTPERPRWQEYYIMAYVFSLAIEKIRQIIASEPTRIAMKFKVFFESVWNIWDTFAILVFSAAVIVRHLPVTPKAARMIYVVNIVFWYFRILEILSVNKYLGPYVKIISKLLRDMSYFVIIVLIVLMSFGIVRQAVHFQEEEFSWFLVRSMFFYPYWMIYGELFADEIDTCTDPARAEMLADGEIDMMCVYGSWIAPALMCIYLLIANILLVNLLIARFNATFHKNNANSREIWKFQRYQLIINYELRPILPPPLIVFNHIYLALKFIRRRCQGKRDTFDSGLKLFLSHDDMEKLHDFEEECAEDYFREKEIQLQSSSDKRIQVINERVENISMRWEDMSSKDNSIKLSLQGVDYRLSVLEEIAVQNKEVLCQLKGFMSRYDARSRNVSASSDKSSSRRRLDSEDSAPDHVDLQSDSLPGTGVRDNTLGLGGETSLTDSSSSTMRSMPSPILVHSRKASKDESLQKFTDYSKSPSKSNHAITRRLERQASIKQRRSLPKVLEQDSSTPTEEIKPSLSERRHASNLHIETNLTVPNSSLSRTNADISDKADTEVNNSDAVYSTAHMIADTQVSTGYPARVDLNENAPGLLMKSKSYDSPLTVQVPAYSAVVPNEFATFTPILTSLRAEYTTITDAIDTTCMINRTPPRSPTSAHPYYGEGMWDDDKNEHFAGLSETATLKQAEEQESRRMGKVIRKRLRQISMDESDSISDIAKLVISEMDVTDDVHSEHEDDDIPGSDENVPQILKEAEMIHEDSGPVTFDAVEIRIRRASTQDGESPYEAKT